MAAMLGWLARYAPLKPFLLDELGKLRTSVLDVGSGPHGLACAYPDMPFAGMDTLFPSPVASAMTAIKNAPGAFPLADASFGTVVCLDVLEHIPRPNRMSFVQELLRVCAERVIIACPSSEWQGLDDLIANIVKGTGQPVPDWLEEHYECGLPTPEEIDSLCTPGEGFTRRPLPVPNGALWAMVSISEMIAPLAAEASVEAHDRRDEWMELFNSACFGSSGRKGFILERIEAADAVVQAGGTEAGTLRALRCQSCAAGFEALDRTKLRCLGCGRVAERDPTGAWDVAMTAPQERAETGATYWYTPTWRLDELRAVLHGFADLDDPAASLVLRAAPDMIDAADAVARANEALGGRELGDRVNVVILADKLSAEHERSLREDAVVVTASSFNVSR